MKKFIVASLVVLGLASFASAAITDGQVLYMPYNEGTGTVTHDLAGGHNGKLYYQNANNNGKWNSPTDDAQWTTGRFGSAVKFYYDGDKKLMDTHVLSENAYNDPWGNARNWSYSFWVKRPSTRHIGWGSSWVNQYSLSEAEGYAAEDESSVDWWDWSGGLEYDHMHTRYDEWNGGGGRNLNTNLSAGGANRKTDLGKVLGSGGDWGDDQWHNIIMTLAGDPAGTETGRFDLKVYVDGALAPELSKSGWGWGWMPMEAFSVGISQELKGIDINDVVDDVGVWNRILTTDEVSFLQSNPAPEPATMSLLALGGLALIRRRK